MLVKVYFLKKLVINKYKQILTMSYFIYLKILKENYRDIIHCEVSSSNLS